MDFPRIVKGINDRVKVVLTSAFAFNEVEISKSGYEYGIEKNGWALNWLKIKPDDRTIEENLGL